MNAITRWRTIHTARLCDVCMRGPNRTGHVFSAWRRQWSTANWKTAKNRKWKSSLWTWSNVSVRRSAHQLMSPWKSTRRCPRSRLKPTRWRLMSTILFFEKKHFPNFEFLHLNFSNEIFPQEFSKLKKFIFQNSIFKKTFSKFLKKFSKFFFSTKTILTRFYCAVCVGNFTGWMWEGSDGGPGWYDSLDDDGEAPHRSAATAKRQRSSQHVLPLRDGWTISTDHRQVIDHRQVRSDKFEDQPSHSRTVVRLSSKNTIVCLDRLIDWLLDQLIDCRLIAWLIDWLIVDWLIGWLIVRSIDGLIDWLIDCRLIAWLIDWLIVDWLIGWLIVRSIDGLIDWLIDCRLIDWWNKIW